jgi:hypothetical protein
MSRTSRIAVPTLAALALATTAAAVPARRMATTRPSAPSAPVADFADRVQASHAADAWASHDAVSAWIRVEMDGREVIAGLMTTSTDASRARLRLSGGTTVVFDGEEAWVAPATSLFQRARWHARTWPYFLAAPYKLSDKGTRLRFLGRQPWLGSDLAAARLTFEQGVGDTPDDWYVAYREEGSDRLAGLAYVATYGRTLEEAEADQRAVVYSDWQDVEGVPVPMTWTFYRWSLAEGPHGEPVGEVTLRDVAFVESDVLTFQRPGNARAEARPPKP